jgi:choline dehydrogenase-like flavoprotein
MSRISTVPLSTVLARIRFNVVDGTRINTGIAYLTAAVRARPNLTIRGDAEVHRIVIEGKRAVGARLVDGEVLPAGEVILAGGTFGSRAILMRSGGALIGKLQQTEGAFAEHHKTNRAPLPSPSEGMDFS